MYLAIFYGRSYLNPSCFGTSKNLLKSTYSSSSFSETSFSLSASSFRFLEGFSLAVFVTEIPDGCSDVFPLAVFSASVPLPELVSLVPLGIPSLIIVLTRDVSEETSTWIHIRFCNCRTLCM